MIHANFKPTANDFMGLITLLGGFVSLFFILSIIGQ
jgi:hypothetical protein